VASKLRAGIAIVGITAVAVLIVGVVAARHFRVDLFDDYRAGYAHGQRLDQHPERCMAAARAAYPDQFTGPGAKGYPGTDEVVAFTGGCTDGAADAPSNPWRGVRAALGGGD
jgi:hypothetical protein